MRPKDCFSFKNEPEDEQINEIATWLEGLTFEQLKFLKTSYDGYLNAQSQSEHGSEYLQ